ncbi:hypothetical protein [Winogradskyella flava]|uniref:hypothetical protein n=1 Tax=Winogradskyella flava TaxID=1884876 RepID=UPI00249193D4|nr:hypothetical protein [Winogradskyella flava]
MPILLDKKKLFKTSSFIILLSILICANLIVSSYVNMEQLRIPRIMTTVILFLWFLNLELERRTLSIMAFSLVLIADITLVGYENKWFCFLRFITFIVINSLLIAHIFKPKFLKNVKAIPLIMILVLFVSCLLMIKYLSEFIDFSVFGMAHEVLYYIYAVTTLLLVLSTVLHSLNDYSKKIDIFLSAVVSFLISDLLLIIGYYSDSYLAIQVERVFHIAAIGLIIYYVILFNRDIKGSKEFI